MSQNNGEDNSTDIFVLDSVFPDASIFFNVKYKSLEEIKNDGLVVLDTNALLLPYILEKESLNAIKSTYKLLLNQKRLIIPIQVVREFAKNRPIKIIELYHNIYQSLSRVPNSPKIGKSGRYASIESLDEYKNALKFEEQINKSLNDYKSNIKKLLETIQQWTWDDPVSKLYLELFNENVIFDPSLDKDEIKKEIYWRKKHQIPPAYKDFSKLNKGIGDLLIWHTILQLGENQKKDIIFVSGDEKADWRYASDNDALYPRYELVDEFRRHSNGCSFHIISLSRLLELYGAESKIVTEVQEEERKSYVKAIRSPYEKYVNFANYVRSCGIGPIPIESFMQYENFMELLEKEADSISDLGTNYRIEIKGRIFNVGKDVVNIISNEYKQLKEDG